MGTSNAKKKISGTLAPIVLFVYNRADHTKKTINRLQKNILAKKSTLFIFSDAPKKKENQKQVDTVRNYLNTISGFKKIIIIHRKKNYGLANSVIAGVSMVLEKHKKAIVLEDDLLTSPLFLKFMNKALDYYKNNEQIFVISGYSYPIKIPKNYLFDLYLGYRSSSWGWATWENRWKEIDWSVKDYKQFKQNKIKQKAFNRLGNLSEMLANQMNGKIDSWAIRRTYAQFKLKKYTVFPRYSLVKNIGFDGTGIHCGKTKKPINNANFNWFPEFSNKLVINEQINKNIKKISTTTFFQKIMLKFSKIISNDL